VRLEITGSRRSALLKNPIPHKDGTLSLQRQEYYRMLEVNKIHAYFHMLTVAAVYGMMGIYPRIRRQIRYLISEKSQVSN